VAAWVPDMFHDFLSVKNHKISTEAREKNKHRFGIPRIFFVHFTELKNNQLLLNKGKCVGT